MGLRYRHIVACLALALGAALADGAMLALLIPLGKGVGTGSFASFWSVPLVRRLIPEPRSFAAGFLLLASLMFALALVKNLLVYVQHLTMGHLRTQFAHRLADSVFARYMAFGKAYFDRTSVGQLATVLEYRHDAVLLFQGFLRMASTALILAAYFGVMLLISWRLTLVALLLFPVVHFASRSILSSARKASQAIKRSTIDIGKQVYAGLGAITLYQLFGQQNQALAAFSETGRRLRDASRQLWELQGLSARIQELTALVALLLMLALTFGVERERASQAAVMLVFFFVARLSLPMLAIFPEVVLDLSERLPKARELLNVFEDEGKFIVPSGSRSFEGLVSEIRFANLTFAYPLGQVALRDVSFTLRRGKMTALVGPTGAGKSTLIHLLLRFYDVQAGTIWIDGVDVREYSVTSLRNSMAFVSQDVALLPGTLRANLQFGVAAPVSEQQMQAAIADARLEDLVNSHPGGVDIEIGERGATLSGGQKQRVAIARALLRKAPIVILDEATSSLDAITEKLVQEAIRNALRGATSLVVAHRFSTIQRADYVVVLKEGFVAEQGTVPELLERQGLFHAMWQQQRFD